MLFPQPIIQNYGIIKPLFKGLNMDFIGQLFGKWEVLKEAGRDKKSHKLYLCKCLCGTEKIHRLLTLKSGQTTQCKSCSLKKINFMPDLSGKIFGKWSVIRRVLNKNDNSCYLCRCECGTEKEIFAYHLRACKSNSCPHCRIKTHGMSYTPTFKIWSGLFRRCYNKNFKAYKSYGGRGIIVHDRWHKFENFLEDMGIRPEGLQIDRIDNDGNYEPGNCRWTTPQINSLNKRGSKVMI